MKEEESCIWCKMEETKYLFYVAVWEAVAPVT